MVATADLGPIVIKNVQVFDGVSPNLIQNATVVLDHYITPALSRQPFSSESIPGFPVGYFIKSVTTGPVDASVTNGARVIDGGGNVLMPGLIDTHYHVTFADLASIRKVIKIAQTPFDADGYMYSADPANPTKINYILDENGSKIKAVDAIKNQLVDGGVKEAADTLLRGFTTLRDNGGWANDVKVVTDYLDRSIKKTADANKYDNLPAPRIWSSEKIISATSGHADATGHIDVFDFVDGQTPQAQLDAINGALGLAVADGVPEMLKATRQNFALSADFIKITPGGGVSSPYDPIDTTTMTADEIKAVVEVAKGFNTYVTAHAYTAETINLLIDCGVKMAEHANMVDDAVMKRISALDHDADKSNDFYVNISPFFPNEFANVKTGEGAIKKAITETGTAKAYAYAKKYDLLGFVGFGSDVMYDKNGGDKAPKMLAELAADINQAIEYQKKIDPVFSKEMAGVDATYTSYDILKMATSVNAKELAESGERTPYLNESGKVLTSNQIGVVAPGAVADLVLAKYDSTNKTSALDQVLGDFSNVDANLLMVMKDGIIYKNSLSPLAVAQAYNASHVSQAEFVATTYQHVLDRLPDGNGLSAWIGALNSNSDNRGAAIKAIYDSAEFKSKNLSNTAFVTEVYNDLLNHAPDAAGQKYWLDALDHGLARTDFVGAVINSAEFANASQWITA